MIDQTRLRTSLLLLAVAALLLSGTPAFAGTPGLPSLASGPALDANLCPNPGLSAALGTPAAHEASIIIPPDFILCTCKTCKEYPDVVCQISPSGYSIVCSDYYRLNCPS
jgi:hypothetical protein